MSGILGVKRDLICEMVSWTSWTCFIFLRDFMMRTMADLKNVSACFQANELVNEGLEAVDHTCISNFRSSSIILCVSSASCLLSDLIAMFRLILTFFDLKL